MANYPLILCANPSPATTGNPLLLRCLFELRDKKIQIKSILDDLKKGEFMLDETITPIPDDMKAISAVDDIAIFSVPDDLSGSVLVDDLAVSNANI